MDHNQSPAVSPPSLHCPVSNSLSPKSEYILLIQKEIGDLKELILRFQGVSVYQDHCARWKHFIEAYDRLIEIIK